MDFSISSLHGQTVTQCPQGMGRLPVDGQGLVDLDVLAGLDTSSAQDALIGVVAVEGVGVVLRIGLVLEWPRLVLYIEAGGCVVDGAILVIVIADRAVEVVVLEDAVEGFALGDVDGLILSGDDHARCDLCTAGANQISVDFHHARIAALDWSHLPEVTDLRDLLRAGRSRLPIERVNQQFAGARGNRLSVDGDSRIRGDIGGVFSRNLFTGIDLLRCALLCQSLWRCCGSMTCMGGACAHVGCGRNS